MLGIQLLGQFSVDVDGNAIVLPSRPAQSLLARLALTPGIAHRREKLAGDLWPDANETNARSNLRHALWRIRDALSPSAEILRADHIAISFERHQGVHVDALDVLRTSQHALATVDDLMRAAVLYRGEMLPGFYDEWVGVERVRLAAAFDSIMNRLVTRLIDEARWTEAAHWAAHWMTHGESTEAACRALMTAQHALGSLDGVRAAYKRCTRQLARDLGVAPSHETQSMFVALSQTAHDKFVHATTVNNQRAEKPAVPSRPKMPQSAQRPDDPDGLPGDWNVEMQGLLRFDPIPFPLMR